MNRTNFVNELQKKLHNDDFSGLISPEPFLFVDMDESKEMSDNLIDLFLKTKEILNDAFNIDIIKEDLHELLFDKSVIKPTYSGKIKLGFDYHSLYDCLLNKDKFESQPNIKIYRLETNNNKGIYQDYILNLPIEEYENFIDDHKKRPPPLEDDCLKSLFCSRTIIDEEYQKAWCFGFKNKKDILKWFNNKEILNKAISDSGAHIAVYSVPGTDYIASSKQAAFKIKNAKKVNQLKIESLNRKKNRNTY